MALLVEKGVLGVRLNIAVIALLLQSPTAGDQREGTT